MKRRTVTLTPDEARAFADFRADLATHRPGAWCHTCRPAGPPVAEPALPVTIITADGSTTGRLDAADVLHPDNLPARDDPRPRSRRKPIVPPPPGAVDLFGALSPAAEQL